MVASLALAACGSEGDVAGPGGCGDGPQCPTGQRCLASVGICGEVPEARCAAGTPWAPGVPIFAERTVEWGLEGVEGVRLAVADLDADGRPDLVVHRGGVRADDFASGERHTWVLVNRAHGRFEDVTEASAMFAPRSAANEGRARPGEVVAFADVNGDGAIDAFTGLTTTDAMATLGETSEIVLNDGSGRFTLGPASSDARRASEPSAPAGASFVDFDRDGHVDLWVPQNSYVGSGSFQAAPQQDRLYRGDGTGAFVDVTHEMGLTTEPWANYQTLNEGRAHTNAWSGAACDLDGDGQPELLAASYGRAPNHLWHNIGGLFENRSVASGYAYDGDLTWQDNQFARCHCQANPSDDGCAGIEPPLVSCAMQNWSHSADRQPFRLGGNSASTLCADLDGDGDLDLLTGEIRHWWAGSGSDGSEVLVNVGESPVRFERPGDDAVGLAIEHGSVSWDEGHMTNAVLDFDQDGALDIYQGASDYPGNRGRLYRQSGPLAFVEVSSTDGIDHHRSHGVVVADFDLDGDQDLVVGHSRARCDATSSADCYPTSQVRFFENVLSDSGNWIQLDLEAAAGTNRAAVGARVTVRAGDLVATREVGGGHGHYGAQDDRIVHVGLGPHCEAVVTIRWPDAARTTQTFGVTAGYRFRVRQGEAPVAVP